LVGAALRNLPSLLRGFKATAARNTSVNQYRIIIRTEHFLRSGTPTVFSGEDPFLPELTGYFTLLWGFFKSEKLALFLFLFHSFPKFMFAMDQFLLSSR
jgi:hypothetical protein